MYPERRRSFGTLSMTLYTVNGSTLNPKKSLKIIPATMATTEPIISVFERTINGPVPNILVTKEVRPFGSLLLFLGLSRRFFSQMEKRSITMP